MLRQRSLSCNPRPNPHLNPYRIHIRCRASRRYLAFHSLGELSTKNTYATGTAVDEDLVALLDSRHDRLICYCATPLLVLVQGARPAPCRLLLMLSRDPSCSPGRSLVFPLAPPVLPLKRPCSLSRTETVIANSKFGVYISTLYVHMYPMNSFS